MKVIHMESVNPEVEKVTATDNFARCVQLELLQNRIGLHGNRLWQLPFTYASFSAVATPLALGQPSVLPPHVFLAGLAMFGLIVLLCMTSAVRGYIRTGKNMNKVEEQLGIDVFTRFGPWHYIPYFLLCVSVIISLSVAALYFRP